MRPSLAVLMMCCAAPAAAQDAPPGALACTSCHDPSLDTALSLSELDADQIVAAVAEIRSGARPATLMNRIAAGFTDDEIRAIADWFARKD